LPRRKAAAGQSPRFAQESWQRGVAAPIMDRTPMPNRPSYKFEERTRRQTVRTPEEANDTLETFAARLGIPENLPDRKALLDLLRPYVVDIHLNIDWYVKRLERERHLQILFTIFSVILLIGIPPLIALLGKLYEGDTARTATLITAMITGILAIHKTLAAWVDKRQLFGHFWRASAELKEVLYSFEQTWDSKAITSDNTLKPELVQAMQTDLARARHIVREERQGFYEIYQSPAFDVFQRLNDALGQGHSLAQQLRSPTMNERAERELATAQRKQSIEAARRRKLALETEISGLESLSAQENRKLAGADPAGRARIEQSLHSLQHNIDDARRELIKVQAELVALSQS
jgi:hypothetical protein